MVNDIKGAQQNVINALVNKQSSNQPGSDTGMQSKGGKESRSDNSKVTLTDTAVKLRQQEVEVGNQSIVDKNRVEAIRKAIADGSYNVDSKRTADKMAQFENLLEVKLKEN